MSLDIPARPVLEPPFHGKCAEHFKEYSTAHLVDLFRQMLPEDEDEAVTEAHARGEASHLDVLVALHERGTREVFDAAVALCRHPLPEDRMIGLRILRELGSDGRRRLPVFEETWALLEGMVETEEDPDVLHWVLACLRYTNDPRILDTLVRFSTHTDPDIRRGIAFSIVGCGADDPRVIAVQLRLAEDPDTEIRGLALYDLVNEITADTPEIREVLTRLLDDPDPAIRLDAKAALRVRDYR
jgi:HEAT repeat protein